MSEVDCSGKQGYCNNQSKNKKRGCFVSGAILVAKSLNKFINIVYTEESWPLNDLKRTSYLKEIQ